MWRDRFPRFLEAKAQLIASADVHSPINTGAMLLKPGMNVFEAGVRVLRRNRYDRLLGFDLIGRPQTALSHLHTVPVWPEINRTRMLQNNDWTFVGGHACQGLFVYLFLVQSDSKLSTFKFPANRTMRKKAHLSTMKVHHFASGAKPWRGSARCMQYFDFMDQPSHTTNSDRDAFCWPLFEQKRRCMMPNLNHTACMECRRLNIAHTCGKRTYTRCDGTGVLVL